MSDLALGCTKPHRGHRIFVSGFMDGHVDHLVYANHSDYPLTFRYPNGSVYERDLDGGTEVIYRPSGAPDA